MQNVVISFELLENMRFRWSRHVMENDPKMEIKSNKKHPKNDSKNNENIIGLLVSKSQETSDHWAPNGRTVVPEQ